MVDDRIVRERLLKLRASRFGPQDSITIFGITLRWLHLSKTAITVFAYRSGGILLESKAWV